MNKTDLDKEIMSTLGNWKQLVSNYQVPNNKKAAFQVINTFLPFVGLWVLIYFTLQYSILLSIPLFLINAFFLVRIFIIQHDCGHQSFFNSKKLNNFIGIVCSVFSFIPYKYWSKVHNFHHGHSGQLEVREIGDIPTITVKEYRDRSSFGRFKYRIFRNPIVTFLVAPTYYLLIPCRYPTIYFNKWSKYVKMTLKDNFWIALAYIVMGSIVGWKMFLIIQFTLVFLFGIVAFWFFYVQHQHEFSYKQWKNNWNFLLASIRGSSYYKLPKVLHWLTGNIGYHHIHHLSSLIPNYNLPKCFDEKPILTKYVTQITFWKSIKLMTYKLWDEEQQKMISFAEYNRLKNFNIPAL